MSHCCTHCGDCNGGWPKSALEFIRDQGITDEACFPYIANNCRCSDRCADWSSRLKRVDETGDVPANIETMKQYLVEKGPLAVAMRYGGSFGADGIYRCTVDSPANHAVVIVGYDETQNYWIVKNSWGSGWNGDGYFKVGCGECSIENYVYYASLNSTPNERPIADPDGPYTGIEDVAILFDGSGSYDPEGSLLTYSWDFGYGSATVTVNTTTVQHSYNAAGTYDVTLTVEDRNGARDTDTTRAEVTAEAVELFFDSFEDYYFSNWVRASTWFGSAQRAVEGSRSAEVSAIAQNASLTLKDAVNLSELSQATLSFPGSLRAHLIAGSIWRWTSGMAEAGMRLPGSGGTSMWRISGTTR